MHTDLGSLSSKVFWRSSRAKRNSVDSFERREKKKEKSQGEGFINTWGCSGTTLGRAREWAAGYRERDGLPEVAIEHFAQQDGLIDQGL